MCMLIFKYTHHLKLDTVPVQPKVYQTYYVIRSKMRLVAIFERVYTF